MSVGTRYRRDTGVERLLIPHDTDSGLLRGRSDGAGEAHVGISRSGGTGIDGDVVTAIAMLARRGWPKTIACDVGVSIETMRHYARQPIEAARCAPSGASNDGRATAI